MIIPSALMLSYATAIEALLIVDDVLQRLRLRWLQPLHLAQQGLKFS